MSHLTSELKYQIIDTKEFLRKIDTMNELLPPLPPTATLVSCDVVALYPSVDNAMGVPAVDRMLNEFPSPLCRSKKCINNGLKIVLNNTVCQFEKEDGSTVFASPNNGTAMGPCHAPDYVDVFMGVLDDKLVDTSPVDLVGSNRDNPNNDNDLKSLGWSRFRDDGFAIIPNANDVDMFEKHLQSLCPGKIKWTISHGREIEYLDVRVSITEEGKLKTDVFSKKLT